MTKATITRVRDARNSMLRLWKGLQACAFFLKNINQQGIKEVSEAIEVHHQEANLLYEALGNKITKKTQGLGNLGDNRVDVAEYWLKIAK